MLDSRPALPSVPADRPRSGEAPFRLNEVFFSRTDERGVIRSGNAVFQRVSEYDWSELLGAPHRTVRHPDMPKGVFRLFWDTLQQGKAIGAYVKNRAKDGRYYWVFASVVPCEGGFVSSRIKPSSGMFQTIQAEYAALLAREAGEGLSPEESARALVARLAELGFESYQTFEAHCLSEELMSRAAALGRPQLSDIARYREMGKAATDLKAATETLIREFEAVRIIPHNMRVMASRLEPTGGPFNTLSGDYGAMSAEISRWFETNVVGEDSNFATIGDSVNFAMFMEGVVGILKECDDQLAFEGTSVKEVDVAAERRMLSDTAGRYQARAAESLALVAEEARRIALACKAMHRHILGLSTTRVLCKIESARMGAAGVGLADIIGQLGRFQETIAAQLDAIARLAEEIQTLAGAGGR